MGSRSQVLEEILTPHLLNYTHQITFPWPYDKPLDAAEVGRVFFGRDYDATPDWSTSGVKSALQRLSLLQLSEIKGKELLDIAVKAPPRPQSTLERWTRIIGLVLLLDQGPRYLCKQGTNARYIYHFFDVLSIRVIQTIVEQQHLILSLSTWHRECGLDPHQSVVRILMLLPPLVHSEDLADQTIQLSLTAGVRRAYERATHTCDPHRRTFEADKRDITLFGRHLDAGPPKDDDVQMPDFVYWLMRYYTSHVAYVRHFNGRSPFRNVAVGRKDECGEKEWLASNHVRWSDADEKTRSSVKKDIEEDRWTPLNPR